MPRCAPTAHHPGSTPGCSRRWAVTVLVAALLLGVTAGCSRAEPAAAPGKSAVTPPPAPPAPKPPDRPPPAPPPAPPPTFGHITGDMAALQKALAEPSPVTFQIHPAGETPAEQKTPYLDKILQEKNWPGLNMLVLVVFAKDNGIRFAMGAIFNQHKVTVDEMLSLVTTHYHPKARQGDPAGALAALIQAVNGRVK